MERLCPAGVDVVGIRAENPGPLSLSGTNTWIVGRDPAWLIDPGPLLASHLAALDREIAGRGGLGGIALTHDHPDHAEALPELARRHPGARIGSYRADGTERLEDGSRFGPLEVLAVAGHSEDHLVFVMEAVAFTGDAVLGEGSVFLTPDPGALRLYLDGLRRLSSRALSILCPGHGQLIEDPRARLSDYLEHRLERERRLRSALAEGRRSVDELLDCAWSETPAALRPLAAATLAAHLDKLDEEGRLPDGVERPAWPPEGLSPPTRLPAW